MNEFKLLTTKGVWFDNIVAGVKQFDFRKGYRGIKVGDTVKFVESDEHGDWTGNNCKVKVNFVMHSSEFPSFFEWEGGEFTIIQFDLIMCPHCDGTLKETHPALTWHYSCTKCGRGWCIQPDGDWHSRFSAGRECYSSTGEYKGEWKDTIDRPMTMEEDQ